MVRKKFLESGYQIVDAVDRGALDGLRRRIFEEAKSLIGADDQDVDNFMNRFHERGLNATELNSFRMRLMQRINGMTDDFAMSIFNAFEDHITAFTGPDVAVQKSVNLVLTCPNDATVGPLHRDAPVNSPFEVVVWVPLVDCYDTKSMYIYDLAATRSMVDEFAEDPELFASVDGATRDTARPVKADYGQALMFWGGLYHGTPVNREPDSRWSLNVRYKNLFSPYGAKGMLDYFKILKLSPLTDLAFAEEARQVMKS